MTPVQRGSTKARLASDPTLPHSSRVASRRHLASNASPHATPDADASQREAARGPPTSTPSFPVARLEPPRPRVA